MLLPDETFLAKIHNPEKIVRFEEGLAAEPAPGGKQDRQKGGDGSILLDVSHTNPVKWRTN